MFVKVIFAVMSLLCLLAATAAEKRRFTLKIYNFTCLIKSERVKYFMCDVKQKAVDNYLFRQHFMFDQNLNNNFHLRMWSQIMPQNAKKSLRLLDTKLNVCEILAGGADNPFIKQLLMEFLRTSNLPRVCPFKRNYLYKVNNYSFTVEFFPHYMPLMNFTYVVEFYEDSNILGTLKTEGALVKRSMG